MSKRIALAVAAMTAVPASAQITTLYFGDGPVPGLPGEVFNDSTFGATTFSRPVVSPDGLTFAIEADLEVSGTFFDEVILVFNLADPSNGLTLREGEVVTPNNVVSSIDQKIDVNNAGVVAFTSQVRDTTNNFPADSDVVFTWDGVTLTPAISGGTAITGGTVDDGGINSPYINNSGALGYQSMTSTEGSSVVFDGNVAFSEQEAVPGAPASTAIIEFETTSFANEGATYLTSARSFPPNRTVDAIVLDGTPVIIGGTVLPGSGFSSVVTDGGPSFAELNESGTWFARGSNVDGTEWVVIDGVVIATEGDALFPGSSETWGELNGITVNDGGDYVLQGITAGGDEVLVLNGDSVLVREGDDVGNGLEIRQFNVDDFVLGNQGDLVFSARLRNTSTGSNAPAGLFAIAIPEPTTGLALAGTAGLLLRRRRS
ncbi:MAG: PEP-CTERM sorting domain-containing protein [Planctomycetota bacterium]